MSEVTNLMPPPDAELAAARRQFVELYGTPLIAASYLRIALFCVSILCLGLLGLNVKTFQAFSRFKPLVIRINDVAAQKPSRTIRSATSRAMPKSATF